MASIVQKNNKQGIVYLVRYRGPDGKQRAKTFPRKAGAMTFAAKIETQVREGDWIDPTAGRVTFGELHTRWVVSATLEIEADATLENEATGSLGSSLSGLGF